MSFALFILGIMLITVAVRNTEREFVDLVKNDFSGPGNFWYWIAALLVVGAVGFIPRLKGLSDALLVLILLVLVLSRGNPEGRYDFFGKLTAALKGTQSNSGAGATAGGGLNIGVNLR